MAIFNAKDRIIECKLVYYGPGRGGKTTNLEYIFKAFNKNTSAEMISINTMGDRTLFFDFLPMGLGKIRGCEVKIQLYTVPGQARYRSTRKMVLKGVDGIVFVADSLEVRRKANLLSLRDLADNLKDEGKSIFRIPLVLQYNKRDLEQEGLPLMPIEMMDRDLNSKLKAPAFPGSALKGTGVGLTLKRCMELTLKHLKTEIDWAD